MNLTHENTKADKPTKTDIHLLWGVTECCLEDIASVMGYRDG